jgi:hypothetical protein
MNIPWTQYHSFGLECRIHASIIINCFSYIFVHVHSINLSPKFCYTLFRSMDIMSFKLFIMRIISNILLVILWTT